MIYDKEKSCKDCPDRYLGCHSKCEFYINRKSEHDKLRDKIHKQNDINYAIYEIFSLRQHKRRRREGRRRK